MTTPKESAAKPAADIVAAPKQIAVIDIGTTSIRMDVAEVSNDKLVRVLMSLQRPISLGRDTFSGGRIRQSTIEECVGILKGFRQVMSEYGITQPNQIRAVSTSTLMEADNRDVFLDRILIASGISVVPIDETEVSRLTYNALYAFLEREPSLSKGNSLVLEVGGGSTKLLLIQDVYVKYSTMFHLGSLRMRETLEKHRTPANRIKAVLEQHIQLAVEQMLHSVPVKSVKSVIAIAGDMHFAMSKLVPNWNDSERAVLPSESFGLAEKIAVTAVDDLVRKYQIPYHEAETAGPALLAYVRVARAFKAEQVIVTRLSLRQGILLEESTGLIWTERYTNQIVQSAMALGERFNYDRNHALHVADLTMRLFKELQPEHQMDQRAEIILKVAALLHDIGLFINNRSHHKHSMYLIANSDLFGLSREDMRFVGLISRYHRRSAPRPTHDEFATLSRDDRITVSKQAAILRVADALDRSHTQRIKDPEFSREDSGFVITVRNVDDVTLERLALEEKAGMFEAVYGTPVVLRTVQAPEGTV